MRRIRFDTWIGMRSRTSWRFCIMLTTAATLHATGVTNIQTAEQAAEALRPIAGDFAFLLFAGGIIGTGLLAVPVLAGSAAYAVAESLRWPIGPGAVARRGARLLRRARGGDAGRRGDRLHAHRPDQGAGVAPRW